ncbi:DJ-1/PfpI family protein [Helicobacter sp. 23-1046]
MAKRVLVPLAEGFEEIEFVSIVDTLRRAGVEVVIAGVNGSNEVGVKKDLRASGNSAGIYTGAHGIEICAEVSLEGLDSSALAGFDGVALAGGWQGMLNLKSSQKLREILQDFKAQGKLVSAICASPIVLDSAGVLAGKFACYPSCEAFTEEATSDNADKNAESSTDKNDNKARKTPQPKPLNGEYEPNASVVRNGNLITAAGPATGILFALEIISYLLGQAKSNEIAEQMLVPYLKSNAKIVRDL